MKVNKYNVLMLAITVAAFVQALKKSDPLKGLCMHPGVNGGAPFQLTNETLDGSNLIHVNEDGQILTLIGAQCILVRDKK